jgi:Flp pilus assembly pilin Flp
MRLPKVSLRSITKMNSGEIIRARVKLPCSIRLNGSELRIARGVTEELSRESLIVVTPSIAGTRWLRASSNVLIAVELPSTGIFDPRVLECAASISRVRAFSSGVRIIAAVHRMAVINRDLEKRARSRWAAHAHTAELVPAVARSQNENPVIFANHRTDLNSDVTGEHTLSFLKNLLIEEDGQDMVEYGLVVAGLVAAGALAFAAYTGALKGALTTLGSSVTAVL